MNLETINKVAEQESEKWRNGQKDNARCEKLGHVALAMTLVYQHHPPHSVCDLYNSFTTGRDPSGTIHVINASLETVQIELSYQGKTETRTLDALNITHINTDAGPVGLRYEYAKAADTDTAAMPVEHQLAPGEVFFYLL